MSYGGGGNHGWAGMGFGGLELRTVGSC